MRRQHDLLQQKRLVWADDETDVFAGFQVARDAVVAEVFREPDDLPTAKNVLDKDEGGHETLAPLSRGSPSPNRLTKRSISLALKPPSLRREAIEECPAQ